MTSGIPQNSILSPLPLYFFISDLNRKDPEKARILKHADDVIIRKVPGRTPILNPCRIQLWNFSTVHINMHSPSAQLSTLLSECSSLNAVMWVIPRSFLVPYCSTRFCARYAAMTRASAGLPALNGRFEWTSALQVAPLPQMIQGVDDVWLSPYLRWFPNCELFRKRGAA